MDPLLFTIIAERLVASCRDNKPFFQVEVDLRTAIGRCYYAGFITCQTFIESLGYKITDRGSGHGIVLNAMVYSKCQELRDVASDLGSLSADRKWADYQLNKSLSEADMMQKAEACLQWSKNVIAGIGSMTKKVKQDQSLVAALRKAIDEWKRDRLSQHQAKDIQ